MCKRLGNKFKRNKGITLIELIVTLAILSIVIMITFSMHIFGNNTFNTGSKQSEVQSNLRLASNYVTKILRYSSNIEILSTMPVTPDTSKEYIYSDSGSLNHYSGGNIKTITSSADGLTTNIEFQEQDPQTVYYKLDSTLKGESYSIDSTVVSLNIGSKSIIGTGTGSAISFTKGEETLMNIISKPVTEITITATSNTVGISGGKLQLTASVQPSDASIKSVTWSVDDTSKAIIDPNTGVLTAVTASAGIPIGVIATANDGSGVKSSTYTVTTANNAGAPVLVTGITVTPSSATVRKDGGTLQLTANIQPSNASIKSVTWSVNNTANATIDSDGLLTTTKESEKDDEINVIATSNDGSGKSSTVTVTVTN